MAKPLVAIVGRPNVGKSMLFNKLVGKRLSIVEDTPGVTRDRLYAECEWCGRKFDIVDTGGIEPTTDNEILLFMREQANIAIGRFLNLALMNLCGYYVKQDRMGTFGYPMPWCLVEDEEACARVGWKPYHVRNGFNKNDSVITLGSTLLWGNNMAPSTTDPVKVMELLAWDISERCQFALGSGRQYTFRTVLMTEPVAAILAQKYKSPEALEKVLINESRRPVKERAFANYYANPGGRKDGMEHNLRQYSAHIAKAEEGRMTKTPQWYDSDAAEMNTIPTMKRGMTAFVITGDNARNKVQTMPGGGYASVKIELPDNWNELMQKLGYQPLNRF